MDKLGCPDIIFIFGATNDCWAGSPLGDYKYEGWTKEDLYTFRPAMAYLLDHMIDRYPNVEIYFLLNSGLKEEFNESVRATAITKTLIVLNCMILTKRAVIHR